MNYNWLTLDNLLFYVDRVRDTLVFVQNLYSTLATFLGVLVMVAAVVWDLAWWLGTNRSRTLRFVWKPALCLYVMHLCHLVIVSSVNTDNRRLHTCLQNRIIIRGHFGADQTRIVVVEDFLLYDHFRTSSSLLVGLNIWLDDVDIWRFMAFIDFTLWIRLVE